jgi:hypothetical protein
MTIKSFPDTIILPTRKDVLRVHLYSKFVQFGIQPFENDIDMVLELYSFGGYNDETQKLFFDKCLEKKYKKSEQSVRNTLSKYTSLGVLEKPKNKQLFVSDKFIPAVECDLLVLQHRVTHADGLQANIQGASREDGERGTDVQGLG